jgi:hypothetical protein
MLSRTLTVGHHHPQSRRNLKKLEIPKIQDAAGQLIGGRPAKPRDQPSDRTGVLVMVRQALVLERPTVAVLSRRPKSLVVLAGAAVLQVTSTAVARQRHQNP